MGPHSLSESSFGIIARGSSGMRAIRKVGYERGGEGVCVDKFMVYVHAVSLESAD